MSKAHTPSIVLGKVFGQNKLVEIEPQSLLHHMLIVGQSGSGKSFLVARLIEEILLRTLARVVVIDPNGDFKQLCNAAPSQTWKTHHTSFPDLVTLSTKASLPVFDSEEQFRTAWDTRRFHYITANPDHAPKTLGDQHHVTQSDLFVHWQYIGSDEQDFLIDLLNVDPLVKTKINLAVQACHEYLADLTQKQALPDGYGLLEVIRTADKFYARDINLGRYPYVKSLTEEDWAIVSGNLQQLYRRHGWMWWNQPVPGWEGNWDAPKMFTDMLGYLLRPFAYHSRADIWNACVLGLDRAGQDDGLLAVNLALYRLWNSAQHLWRNSANVAGDRRVPTFIVIDEAHNYAPTEHRTPVQKRVTDRLIQIAAEGRKYGLYLILATQRPRKLHPHLVLECENCCLLRVQSKVEQEFLEKEFGIPHEDAGRIGRYEQGHALLHGRWMGGAQNEATIAPARTVVGGGGVPDLWLAGPTLETLWSERPAPVSVSTENTEVPDPDSHVLSDGEMVDLKQTRIALLRTRICDAVCNIVSESLAPVSLAVLGTKVRDLFGTDLIDQTEWAGMYSLTNLVREMGTPNVVYSGVAKGFVFDPTRHEEPIHERLADRVGKTHPYLSSLAERLEEDYKITVLTPFEFALVFRILADEIAKNGFAMSRTAKTVRDEAAAKGIQLTRAGINFILARLFGNGNSFASRELAAEELGKLYVDRLLEGFLSKSQIPNGKSLLTELVLSDLVTADTSQLAEPRPKKRAVPLKGKKSEKKSEASGDEA